MCFLSQKLVRGVPDDLTFTSPFGCIRFACVVHPVSGAGIYLANPAVTLKIQVTLVKLKLLLYVRRDVIILTSIQMSFITNNEVSASLAGLQLSSGEFPN